MNRKLGIVALLVAFFGMGSGFSLTRGDFERIVDFTTTLKSLDQMLKEGIETFDSDRYIVVHGTVAEISILSERGEEFRVQIEFVDGEWIGLEEVRRYSTQIQFQGEQFAALFPRRTPRNPSPEIILLNSRAIVVARVLRPITTVAGSRVWRLDGIYIRRI